MNKKDTIYLILVFLLSVIIIYKLIKYYMFCGIYDPDKAIYLMDALKFAEMDYYNICPPENIYYSPTICFLTSLLFRLGLVDKLAIFIVTGIFGVICEIGLYIFLKQRFNSILSLTGVVIFGSLSVVLGNIGSGGIDIPSIAISIWAIIFTIVAIEKNTKYFILVFPLLVVGFFTRYTVGFILPVILVYYCLSKDILGNIEYSIHNKKLKEKLIEYLRSNEFKYILISISLGISLGIIICLFIIYHGGSLTFLKLSISTFNGTKPSPTGVDYNISRLFYLKNLPNILFEDYRFLDSTLSYSLLFILCFGFLLKVKNKLKLNKKIKNNKLNLILKTLFILSIIGTLFGFITIRNHMLTNICILVNIIIMYYLIDIDNDNLKFSLLNLSWLSICFIFASLYNTKVPRYFIPILIPFIYFIIWGFEEILNELIKYKNKLYGQKDRYSHSSKINIIPLILMLFLLISTLTFVDETIYEIGGEYGIGLVEVTNYLKTNDHDPNFNSKNIIGNEHFFSIIKWYLKVNGTYLRDFETEKIDNINASYAIINTDMKFKNYHKIYNSKEVYLFAHN